MRNSMESQRCMEGLFSSRLSKLRPGHGILSAEAEFGPASRFPISFFPQFLGVTTMLPLWFWILLTSIACCFASGAAYWYQTSDESHDAIDFIFTNVTAFFTTISSSVSSFGDSEPISTILATDYPSLAKSFVPPVAITILESIPEFVRNLVIDLFNASSPLVGGLIARFALAWWVRPRIPANSAAGTPNSSGNIALPSTPVIAGSSM